MIIDPAELKRRYFQRIAGVRDNKVYIGPESVSLEIINTCNLRCRYCVTEHSPGNPAHFEKARFFSWESFLGIVRDCVDLNVDQIILTGTGEPTLHPLFGDMMRHLEQQPLKVVLTINGTCPADYCSDVIKADHVIVNLGAVDRQQYLDLQGKDLFDRVVANIKHLVSLRDTSKPGFHVEIAYVVNTINIDQIPKMRDLAFILGVNSVDFRKLIVHEYNREIALPRGSASDLGSYDNKMIVNEFSRRISLRSNARSDLGGGEKLTPPACFNGWFYILIMIDGNFSNCYAVPELGTRGLYKNSLKQFWFSPQMKKIRLLGAYGHTPKMFKACQTCPCYDENVQRSQDSKEIP